MRQWHTLIGCLDPRDVSDRREVCGLQALEVHLPIRGDIRHLHLIINQFLTVFHTKGLQGLVVDIGQNTILVIEDHIHERRFKHGMITQHQVLGVLRP